MALIIWKGSDMDTYLIKEEGTCVADKYEIFDPKNKKRFLYDELIDYAQINERLNYIEKMIDQTLKKYNKNFSDTSSG
jgi:hypothetical protein